MYIYSIIGEKGYSIAGLFCDNMPHYCVQWKNIFQGNKDELKMLMYNVFFVTIWLQCNSRTEKNMHNIFVLPYGKQM